MPSITTPRPAAPYEVAAGASDADLLRALRLTTAAASSRVLRILDVATIDDLARPVALAEQLGWQCTFRLTSRPGVVDLLLGVSL